jgi:HPt (histidine-containing phosphotransfer) domain-containing protein
MDPRSPVVGSRRRREMDDAPVYNPSTGLRFEQSTPPEQYSPLSMSSSDTIVLDPFDAFEPHGSPGDFVRDSDSQIAPHKRSLVKRLSHGVANGLRRAVKGVSRGVLGPNGLRRIRDLKSRRLFGRREATRRPILSYQPSHNPSPRKNATTSSDGSVRSVSKRARHLAMLEAQERARKCLTKNEIDICLRSAPVMGDREFMMTMLKSMSRTCEERMDKASLAASQGDMDRVWPEAHAIWGAAVQIGLNKLTAAARALEDVSRKAVDGPVLPALVRGRNVGSGMKNGGEVDLDENLDVGDAGTRTCKKVKALISSVVSENRRIRYYITAVETGVVDLVLEGQK